VNTTEKRKILTTAHKGLMFANPDYFALSGRDQEIFRVTKDENASKKIKCIILENLLETPCGIDTVDDLWEEIETPNLFVLNWAMLLTDGIGEDFIYLNEGLADGVTLLNFESLYDFDFDDYLFQEKSNKKEFSNYQSRDYYPFRFPPWIRLLINDEFHYGELTSVASYIQDGLNELGSQYIDSLIPHDFVEGKNHGKPTKLGFTYDMVLDAAGLEGQLDELNDRWHSYIQERCLSINKTHTQSAPAVFIKDNSDEPNRSFIFNNEAALKQVRWRSFLTDCQPLMADYALIDSQIKTETNHATAFLDRQYRDIMDNYDPKIVKFSKKRKVVMTSGFLDDLDDLDKIDYED
jgi:hypothetical protein